MRILMLIGCALITAVISPPLAAEAADYHPWCSQNSQSSVSCSFDSWAQCSDAIRGLAGICAQNPAPPPVETPATLQQDEARAAAQAAASKRVTLPGGQSAGADPDPTVRSYLQRDGKGASGVR
jgi:Protein of unknown function (DUF3551)